MGVLGIGTRGASMVTPMSLATSRRRSGPRADEKFRLIVTKLQEER